MTEKTAADIAAQITADFADNTTADISPADLRGVADALNDSKAQRLPAVQTEGTTARTAALTDRETFTIFTNAAASTFTLPADSVVAFPVGSWFMGQTTGAGGLSIAAGAGATVQGVTAFAAANGFSMFLARKTAANTWTVAALGTSNNIRARRLSVGIAARTTNQAITASTDTYVNFSDEIRDDDGYIDLVADDTKLTVPAGVTLARLGVLIEMAADADLTVWLGKNGTRFYKLLRPGNSGRGFFGSILEPVTAGDYFQLTVNTAAGATLAAAELQIEALEGALIS